MNGGTETPLMKLLRRVPANALRQEAADEIERLQAGWKVAFDRAIELQTENERLRQEKADLRHDNANLVKTNSDLATEVVELLAKLVEAQKDARRLDWLEAMKSHTNAIDLCVYWRFSGRAFGGIREAVDAAIAAQENTDD